MFCLFFFLMSTHLWIFQFSSLSTSGLTPVIGNVVGKRTWYDFNLHKCVNACSAVWHLFLENGPHVLGEYACWRRECFVWLTWFVWPIVVFGSACCWNSTWTYSALRLFMSPFRSINIYIVGAPVLGEKHKRKEQWNLELFFNNEYLTRLEKDRKATRCGGSCN